MARLAAFTDLAPYSHADLLRTLTVIGCALALILAKTALPF